MRKLPLKYLEAPDIKQLVDEIIDNLDLSHVISQSVHCFRSRGSKSRCIIARIHGLGRLWQTALGHSPAYIIEVISEHYDKLSQEDKEKTLIHELMHIPKGFKGGFRPHKGYISRKRIEKMHKEYVKKRNAQPLLRNSHGMSGLQMGQRE
jgi:predicted metallopeptidase